MDTKEIEKLSEKYLDDSDNRSDYHAFFYDKDEKILKKVVYAWCHAQGYNENDSNLLAMYMIEMAQLELNK